MPNLIHDKDDAYKNALLFNSKTFDPSSIEYRTFSKFSHWYYFRNVDIFAPSKYIGYQRSDSKIYDSKGNGGVTERHLKQWSEKLDKTNPDFIKLIKKLDEFAVRVGRRLSAKVKTSGGIHVFDDYQIGTKINAIDDLGSDDVPVNTYSGRRYARDPKVRKAVLKRAKGKCEFCGEVGFLKPNGANYLETHHIVALANDGSDRISNVIALCSNHHREAHFGENYLEIEKKMIEMVDKKNSSRS